MIGIESHGQSKTSLLGDSHFEAEQFDQAKHLYEKSLKQGKNKNYRGTIYFQIAECIRLGMDSISEYHYDQSIPNLKREFVNQGKKDPLNPDGSQTIEITRKYGFCYYRLNNLEMAKIHFKIYIRSVPHDQEVLDILTKIE